MFISISNISSKIWSKEQLEKAHKYGEIVDIAFPEVVPEEFGYVLEEIASGIKEQLRHLNTKKGDCVCIAGEYGITFDIVDYVHSCLNYVICVYPIFEEGYGLEKSYHKFIKFRIY